MATNYFNLPTVDPDSTLSFPDAVNGLAIATDDVLQSVQDSFGSIDVTDLPVASTKELGVVRVGDGFRVFADGTLSTTAAPFKLRPATDQALGGVYIGTNVEVVDDGSENDGSISIGFGAFNTTAIGTTALKNGGVATADIKDYAITREVLDGSVINSIEKVANVFANAERYYLEFGKTNSSGSIATDTNGTTGAISLIKVTDELWLASAGSSDKFDDIPIGPAYSYKQDWTDYYIGIVNAWNTLPTPFTVMTPASIFSETFKVYAYGWNITANGTKLAGILEFEINGATGKAARTWYKTTDDQVTRWSVPLQVISKL